MNRINCYINWIVYAKSVSQISFIVLAMHVPNSTQVLFSNVIHINVRA